MKIVEFDVEKHINVEKHIENMTEKEMQIARIMYESQILHNETSHKKFNDWLWDYAHTYLFESGEDK